MLCLYLNRSISSAQAIQTLNLSSRQFWRLLARFPANIINQRRHLSLKPKPAPEALKNLIAINADILVRHL